MYKDSLKDENGNPIIASQSNSNGMGGGHTSNRIKDANLKSNLMGNIRNMSVPRGSQQKSYMLSS